MTDFYPPNHPPKDGSEATFYSFDMVEERLVEAIAMCWRLPDRERGWQTIRAFWPEMRRHNHFGDYADTEATPRRPPLTRAEIGAMEEALGWLDAVPPAERKLLGLALARLARGEKRVPWRQLLAPMGLQRGADGLRMRYSRAITKIANRLNAAENRAGGVSRQVVKERENKGCSPRAS